MPQPAKPGVDWPEIANAINLLAFSQERAMERCPTVLLLQDVAPRLACRIIDRMCEGGA